MSFPVLVIMMVSTVLFDQMDELIDVFLFGLL